MWQMTNVSLMCFVKKTFFIETLNFTLSTALFPPEGWTPIAQLTLSLICTSPPKAREGGPAAIPDQLLAGNFKLAKSTPPTPQSYILKITTLQPAMIGEG